MKPPDEVPDDKPAESEPTDSDNPYGSGDPYALGGGSGLPPATKAVVEPPPPPPPPPPKPKPRGPIRVSENVTPPSCSIGTPAYPESARSSGIQGTVIVKYVVTESGAITSVQVMRGPAELRAVSAAAVQNAHCTPARLDGAPVSVYRIARFPFRLKT